MLAQNIPQAREELRAKIKAEVLRNACTKSCRAQPVLVRAALATRMCSRPIPFGFGSTHAASAQRQNGHNTCFRLGTLVKRVVFQQELAVCAFQRVGRGAIHTYEPPLSSMRGHSAGPSRDSPNGTAHWIRLSCARPRSGHVLGPIDRSCHSTAAGPN